MNTIHKKNGLAEDQNHLRYHIQNKNTNNLFIKKEKILLHMKKLIMEGLCFS
jgi:hypothetical protein